MPRLPRDSSGGTSRVAQLPCGFLECGLALTVTKIQREIALQLTSFADPKTCLLPELFSCPHTSVDAGQASYAVS